MLGLKAEEMTPASEVSQMVETFGAAGATLEERSEDLSSATVTARSATCPATSSQENPSAPRLLRGSAESAGAAAHDSVSASSRDPASAGSPQQQEEGAVAASSLVPPRAVPQTPQSKLVDDACFCVDPRFVFDAEFDDAGVYFYQAFNEHIADYAVAHGTFRGCPQFCPQRMTWIKPSFAWVMYRSGYASKHNQTRVLKLQLAHARVAELLQSCQCRKGGGGSLGRVQWDPARDVMSSGADNREPRVLLHNKRAIQIGLKGRLSALYVDSVLNIQDATALAREIGAAHRRNKDADTRVLMEAMQREGRLPTEKAYMPWCAEDVLVKLKMLVTK